MSKEKNAVATFRAGNNYAQSVLSSFAEEYDIDNDFALSISSGFGAGMGRLMETCGAITGAFMVIGIHNNNIYKDELEARDVTYQMIQKFSTAFCKKHKSTNCGELINCDLRIEEGRKHFNENELFDKVCVKCVRSSVTILEELLT